MHGAWWGQDQGQRAVLSERFIQRGAASHSQQVRASQQAGAAVRLCAQGEVSAGGRAEAGGEGGGAVPERAQAELPLPPAGGVQVRAQGDLLLQLLFLLLFPLLLLLLLLLLHLLLLQVGAEGVLLLEAREDAH